MSAYEIVDGDDDTLSLRQGDEVWATLGVGGNNLRNRALVEGKLKKIQRALERNAVDAAPDPRDEQIDALKNEVAVLRADLEVALEYSRDQEGDGGEAYRAALEEIRSEATTNVRKAKLIAEQALGGSVQEDETDAVEE